MYGQGYRYFLTGMAVGFDLVAADIALSLRTELKGLRVVAVIPFEGMQSRFSESQRALFERVCCAADEVICLAPKYSVAAYTVRNNFLVDNASAIITYFDGSKGGTAYTVRRAVKNLVSKLSDNTDVAITAFTFSFNTLTDFTNNKTDIMRSINGIRDIGPGYDGTSVDLGSVCGKPFTVATLIVNDPGDSTILDDLR